ncbi:MAG: hypothetical protein IJZ75_06150 [Clostridia bacterium]|nr:hypothetical protein [Clostridia bacterium]
MKKLLLLLLIFSILLSFSSCIDYDLLIPKSTKWVSHKGDIELLVAPTGKIVGTMKTDGEEIKFYGVSDVSGVLSFFPIEDFHNERQAHLLESWRTNIKTDKMKVTVLKTTYFDVGEKIDFTCVNKEVKESEIYYPEMELFLDNSDRDIVTNYGDVLRINCRLSDEINPTVIFEITAENKQGKVEFSDWRLRQLPVDITHERLEIVNSDNIRIYKLFDEFILVNDHIIRGFSSGTQGDGSVVLTD